MHGSVGVPKGFGADDWTDMAVGKEMDERYRMDGLWNTGKAND